MTFLMTWVAAVVAWAWEAIDESQAKVGLLSCSTAVIIALLVGGVSMAYWPITGDTVRVAGLVEYDMYAFARTGPNPQTEQAAFRQATAAIHARYLAATEREAQAGAQIVLWPEAAGNVLKEDEPELVQQAQEITRQEGIYLLLPLYVHADEPGQDENKALLIDPRGQIVLEHYKYGANSIETARLPGEPVVPSVETPYGRLGVVICWDGDFFRVMRQGGQAGVDIMLIPALDWREITPFHTNLAEYRAIENGYSLVRVTDNGLSVAVDRQGRVLAAVDNFRSPTGALVAQVPTEGRTTPYARLGDWVAWLCVGLSVLWPAASLAVDRPSQRARF